MIYLKINDIMYPANITGLEKDKNWDNRHSKSITLEMSYEAAQKLFVNDLAWSQIFQGDSFVDQNGETVVPARVETDCSEFCVLGDITVHANGTVTVKMGKKTDLETRTDERDQALADLEDVMLIAYGGI